MGGRESLFAGAGAASPCTPVLSVLEKWSKKDEEFKVVFSYIASTRLNWAI